MPLFDTKKRFNRDVAIELHQQTIHVEIFVHVFLFGSSISSSHFPNDIDVLIVYPDANIDKIGRLLHSLSENLERKLKHAIDITALSEKELSSTNFLEKLNEAFIQIK